MPSARPPRLRASKKSSPTARPRSSSARPRPKLSEFVPNQIARQKSTPNDEPRPSARVSKQNASKPTQITRRKWKPSSALAIKPGRPRPKPPAKSRRRTSTPRSKPVVKPGKSRLKKVAANRNSTARLKLKLKTPRTALKGPLKIRKTKPRATPRARRSETILLRSQRQQKLAPKPPTKRIKLKQSAARSSNRREKGRAKTKKHQNHNQCYPLQTRLPRLLNDIQDEDRLNA